MIKKIYKKIKKVFINFSKKKSRKNLYPLLFQAMKKYYQPNKKVISIGAGGEINKKLKEKNFNFQEIDIDPNRKPDIVLSAENMNIFPDNSVDIFICSEVLGHIKNPFKAIAEIKRILKPGGVVIGSTSFMIPINDDPVDYYRFTKYGLKNIFKNFQKIQLTERNSYIESVYVILLRLINLGTKKELITATIIFPFFILAWPMFKITSFLITSPRSTSGYFFIFKKNE